MSTTTASKSVLQKEDNFFAGTDAFIWEKYLSSRPDYTLSSFYDLLYSYHAAHFGEWETAYDVGCGPGQVAAQLASKFTNVHGSDANKYIVNVAKTTFHSKTNLDYEECGVEEIVSKDPRRAASANMVTAAECIPLMNTDAAMATFSQLLKPNGTVAIWFYGGPIYASPDADDETIKKVQALHRKITEHSFEEFRPLGKSSWKQACTKISSWLDNVPFDPNHWKDVRRVKWNSNHQLFFIDLESYDYDFKTDFVNKVRDEEVVEQINDREFWIKKDVEFEWAKEFIDAQVPRTEDYVTYEVKELYEELETLMEGHRWNVGWPVVLLLATKK
jgi:SAM-dependent methyltransferase